MLYADVESSFLSSQAVIVYEILNYTENSGQFTVGHGVGLAFALFSTEFSKAFLMSLMWAMNLRTATRLKGAFSCLAFKKAISLRVHSGISMGEVKHTLISLRVFLNLADHLLQNCFADHLHNLPHLPEK